MTVFFSCEYERGHLDDFSGRQTFETRAPLTLQGVKLVEGQAYPVRDGDFLSTISCFLLLCFSSGGVEISEL